MFNNVVNLFQPKVCFTAKKKDTTLPLDRPGQIQYFFSDKDSFLPVRDVLNTQKAGHKTEPHLENGSENYIKPCVQHQIKNALNRGAEYLFLITKNVNKQMKEFCGNQFIVGYIKIKEAVDRTNAEGKKFTAAKGDVRMVSYEDAIPVKDIFGMNLSRVGISQHGRINREMTDQFVAHLNSKEDITDKLIDEIIKLDKDNLTCLGKGCSNCGQCSRYEKTHKKNVA